MSNSMVVGLIIALFIYTFIAWRSREQALLVLVTALPLYLVRFSLGPLPTTLLECMIGLLFVVWAIRDKRFFSLVGTLYRGHKFFGSFLFLFLLAATISIFVSGDLRSAMGIWRAYFIEPALVFLIAFDVLRTKEQVSRVICAAAISAAYIAAIAVYQRFTGWHIPAPWLSELRVTSIYPYPNAVGLYIAPIIPLCIVQLFDSLKVRKNWLAAAWYFLVTCASLFAIYFAKTEAAIVALAVAIPLMGLAWNMKTRIVTVLLCVIISAVIFSSPGLVSSIQEKLLLRDWSGQVRQTVWKESRAMLSDRVIFGAGLAGYQTAMEPYHKAAHLEIFLYPHTIVLNFWSETGLLGLFAFVMIILALFFLLYQSVRMHDGDAPFVRLYALGFFGALLVILIHGLVDAPYFKNDLAVFFWILIALVLRLWHSAKKEGTI